MTKSKETIWHHNRYTSVNRPASLMKLKQLSGASGDVILSSISPMFGVKSIESNAPNQQQSLLHQCTEAALKTSRHENEKRMQF